MADPNPTRAGLSSRPRGKGFLRIDLQNAYAQIQVSPLASDDEISAAIAKRRGDASRRAKQRGDRGEDLEEILELDHISELIGDARKRKAYDEANPQNSLLTVQPSLSEQAFARHRRMALVSEWLCAELDEGEFLPSPQCLSLWAPRGLSAELQDFLAAYVTASEPSGDSPAAAPATELTTDPLSVQTLDKILNENL